MMNQNGAPNTFVPALGQGDINQMMSDISETNFEEMFYHSMLIYRMECAELAKKDVKIRQLKEQGDKSQKMLNTNRMIIKFRDARIKDLEKKHRLSEGEQNNKYKEEIALLKQQISDHPEVSGHLHTIDNLKNALEYLNKNKNIEIFNQFTASKKQELISEYKKLKNSKQIDTEESLNTNKDKRIELENENRELTNKLMEQENMYNQKIKDFQSKLVDLESQLAGKKAECQELNNMLETARQSNKIQVENLVSIHNSTIKSITTPQRATYKRQSSLKMISTPAKLRLLDDTNSPALKDMSDISLDSSPGILLKSNSSTPQLYKATTNESTPSPKDQLFKTSSSTPNDNLPSNPFKSPMSTSLRKKVVEKQAEEVEKQIKNAEQAEKQLNEEAATQLKRHQQQQAAVDELLEQLAGKDEVASAQLTALQSEVDSLKQQKEQIEDQLEDQ